MTGIHTHVRVNPTPALALVTLTTCIRTRIQAGCTAPIPATTPVTTSTTSARHHPHRDPHTRVYQNSRGMSPIQSGPPAG
ncbi:hypothetical protein EDD15DRAFT_2324105 [Pisolithus albus]|nr:hypothetical protein EDD15DRAFT_2324105 [Pisolithus albus]